VANEDTGEDASMSAEENFHELNDIDAVRLVANTAAAVRDAGHAVQVHVAKVRGEVGIMIWMPGYEVLNGQIVRFATSGNGAEGEAEEAAAVATSGNSDLDEHR
jgi:hypothetical protein